MNNDHDLPVSWQLTPLADLLTGIETGKSFKCNERPPTSDEVGVVKVSAVSWGEFQEQESKTCKTADRVNPSLYIQRGDFLFSRANTVELVGACVIVRQVNLRVMLSDKILRFQFVGKSMKPWVLNLLRSCQGRCQIEALASGKFWYRCPPPPNRPASSKSSKNCCPAWMRVWRNSGRRRKS